MAIMKKLNITKERYEKSRYFKNKYGTLEYVSESGNLYKTDKGKVLMFKESRKLANESSDEVASPGNVQVDDILYCTSCYDFKISTFYKVLAKRGQSTLVLQRLKKNYTGSQSDGVAEPTDEVDSDYRPITVRYGKHGFKIGGNRLYVWDGTPLEEYNYSESKKFGRKFNESDDEIRDAVNDACDKYRACSTEPKVCQAIKINDDGTEQKTSIWMGRGNSIGGIVKAIKDGRLRKVLKFSESSKPKFGRKFKESERKCPYCGNTIYVNSHGDSGGEYVCPHCGYDSEL